MPGRVPVAATLGVIGGLALCNRGEEGLLARNITKFYTWMKKCKILLFCDLFRKNSRKKSRLLFWHADDSMTLNIHIHQDIKDLLGVPPCSVTVIIFFKGGGRSTRGGVIFGVLTETPAGLFHNYEETVFPRRNFT